MFKVHPNTRHKTKASPAPLRSCGLCRSALGHGVTPRGGGHAQTPRAQRGIRRPPAMQGDAGRGTNGSFPAGNNKSESRGCTWVCWWDWGAAGGIEGLARGIEGLAGGIGRLARGIGGLLVGSGGWLGGLRGCWWDKGAGWGDSAADPGTLPLLPPSPIFPDFSRPSW